MEPVMTGHFQDEELYYSFKKFDTDNTGYLSVKEFQQFLSRIGQNFTEQQILLLIDSVNDRNDGTVNFEGNFY
jgi:Ca2+-binding EF-hand superfamily protein